MRVFTAVEIPTSLHPAIAALRDNRLAGARWTNRHQWHITLHFIGEVESIEPIQAAIQNVTYEDFSLALGGIGTFPPRGKPRILWGGVTAPQALQALHHQLGEALKQTGFVPEQRPYHPHLTLARFKQAAPSRQALQAYREQHSNFATVPFQAKAITLYESELTSTGARYHIRSQHPLTD